MYEEKAVLRSTMWSINPAYSNVAAIRLVQFIPLPLITLVGIMSFGICLLMLRQIILSMPEFRAIEGSYFPKAFDEMLVGHYVIQGYINGF